MYFKFLPSETVSIFTFAWEKRNLITVAPVPLQVKKHLQDL